MSNTKIDSALVEEMFSVGAHYGYSKSRRHPSTGEFIFGVKNKVEIFDLEKTSQSLDEAQEFVKSLGALSKKILFVSGKHELRSVVRDAAISLGLPYVAGRWIGGTLTNFSEINKRVKKLLDLKEKREKGELSKYTKKEQLLIDRDIDDLEIKFGGLTTMVALPSALFVIDSKEEEIAVAEANHLAIPVISISNSDCDLEKVDFPIPGNDSNLSSVKFFIDKIKSAYSEGKKKTKI